MYQFKQLSLYLVYKLTQFRQSFLSFGLQFNAGQLYDIPCSITFNPQKAMNTHLTSKCNINRDLVFSEINHLVIS